MVDFVWKRYNGKFLRVSCVISLEVGGGGGGVER